MRSRPGSICRDVEDAVPYDAPLLTPFRVPALSLEARMVIPMKKGILTLIFTLIFFMAALGFGKNLHGHGLVTTRCESRTPWTSLQTDADRAQALVDPHVSRTRG